jgi:hypothetical protein
VADPPPLNPFGLTNLTTTVAIRIEGLLTLTTEATTSEFISEDGTPFVDESGVYNFVAEL